MKIEPPAALRVMRFYTVGALGIGVQLAALALFRYAWGVPYMVATALAVETAVIHNYLWHERWTWASRITSAETLSHRFVRFAKFNLTTGLLSILSNLVLTRLFVEHLGIPLLIANLLAVATASVATYLCGDLFVFRASGIESRHDEAGHTPYLSQVLRWRIHRSGSSSTRSGRE